MPTCIEGVFSPTMQSTGAGSLQECRETCIVGIRKQKLFLLVYVQPNKMLALRRCFVIAVFGLNSLFAEAICDGNPHKWGRMRRCDMFDEACPSMFRNCTTCEGIGGIATSDKPDAFTPVPCKSVGTATEMKAKGIVPPVPMFPKKFVNRGFHEVQIFVKHDPLCLVQIPASVSNGTHCYKPQEGAFNYDIENVALRIDYLRSKTPLPGTNMTEIFHHIDTFVHPEITKYGIDPVPTCLCINVGVGPVSHDWAADAQYVGRELLGVEFLDNTIKAPLLVDHFVKGPHHVWTDVESRNIVRLWQPYNGLEIFDPAKWEFNVTEDLRKLDLTCKIGAKACINPRL